MYSQSTPLSIHSFPGDYQMNVDMPGGRAGSGAGIPAYQRIKNYVVDNIRNGVWKAGDPIPTEQALCDMFGVSRMTVNRALRELVTAGLLVRHKGAGSFVAPPKFQSTLIQIRSIAHDIRDRGHTHHSKVLALESLHATDSQREELGIPPRQPLYRSVIVHYENNTPLQVEDRLVDATVAPDYLEQDWHRQTPNEYLMQVAPLPVGRYLIEIRQPPADVAAALSMPAGAPCLVMERTTYSNNRFASHAVMWHPGDRYRFTGTW